jgi:hypothetical protein
VTHPIGLSQSQMDAVVAGAARVPPEWRNRFLDAVVDQLLLDMVTDQAYVRFWGTADIGPRLALIAYDAIDLGCVKTQEIEKRRE